MKIQYISCHAVLEYDEMKLWTELGHEVYGNGCYRDPRGAYTLPRPGIPNATIDEKFIELTALHPKTKLVPELIEPYDVLVFMSGDREQPLLQNWDSIKHKKVIWRTIGQSTSATEKSIQPLVKEGLKIVRYSPKEKNIPNYAGDSAIIRFYKDPDEFTGWNGNDKRPINFTQTLQGRSQFCHYDQIMMSLIGFEGAKVYGTGNSDLGLFNGGEVTAKHQIELLQNARVYVYTGTWPASYTLSFIEAMMLGIPIVAISKKIAHVQNLEAINFYEVDEIIENGKNGFICDSIQDMRARITQLLNDEGLAKKISIEARKIAIDIFGKKKIASQWKEFFEKI